MMMKQAFVVTGVLVAALSAGSAAAQSDVASKKIGVSLKVGSAGAGFDLTAGINDSFKVRGGYATYKYSVEEVEDGVTYEGDLTIGGWNLLADYHPFQGGFRVTGGAFGPSHKLAAKGVFNGPAQTIDLNGTLYSSADIRDVSATTKWKNASPYLGIGYDGFHKMASSGFYFTTDVGVVFSGKPSTRLTATCVNPARCGSLNTNLAAEEADLRDAMDGTKYLPVVQIGFGYRF
jgi:hypothetical protein